jgi:phage tail-like protein
MSADPGFRYLNLNNDWTQMQLQAGVVQRSDGAITLAPVPQVEAAVAELLPPAIELTGAASLDADAQGNLYFADPTRHQIWRWDVCTGESAPLPCFGGEGSLPGQLRVPRGVLVSQRSLYVADSGNHRIQIIDLHSLQLRDIVGQPDPYALPQASDLPGRFNEPWDLVADQAGDIYVLDWGNRRVQKFTAHGRLIPQFGQAVGSTPTVPQQPRYLAIARFDAQERLLVLDIRQDAVSNQPRGKLLVYQLDGVYDATRTDQWQSSFSIEQPTGLVATADMLYVGEGDRILAFDLQGHLIGAARGYRGAIAGLSVDRQGRVLVHPGSGGAVMRLIPAQAYSEAGSFLAGPFSINPAAQPPTHWHRLVALADPLALGAHLQFFTYTSFSPDSPDAAAPQLDALGPGEQVAAGIWWAAPLDSLDLLVLHQPAPYLWIKGVLRGDGTVSPVLHQMRLEHNPTTLSRHLPAIYRRGGAEQVFLERFLALFQSELDAAADLTNRLPQLFDAQAAPDRFPDDWLDWLAGWLAFDLDETWTSAQRRQALSEAFALYSQRGTAAGLRHLIRLYTQATAFVAEPARAASLWSLGESALGFTTMLVPADAQGAVVGTTAVVNQSHLIAEANYGAPLFEDIAHSFCVQVYAADLPNPAAMQRVQQMLEQEKPAHTTYHLCPIEARMRVGLQARLGVDAIVGAPPPDLVLHATQQLGIDTVLAAPDQTGSRLGQNARLGQHTNLQ